MPTTRRVTPAMMAVGRTGWTRDVAMRPNALYGASSADTDVRPAARAMMNNANMLYLSHLTSGDQRNLAFLPFLIELIWEMPSCIIPRGQMTEQ